MSMSTYSQVPTCVVPLPSFQVDQGDRATERHHLIRPLPLHAHTHAMKAFRKARSYLDQRRSRRNLAQKASLQAVGDQDGGRSKLPVVKVLSAPPKVQTQSSALAASLQQKIDDTESDLASTSTPAALSEEIILVSWLITLLRTREDSEISFEWALRSREDEGKDSDETTKVMRLSAGEVMPGLDAAVEQVAAAISRHMATAAQKPGPAPLSLLLSTGSLLRTAAGATKEEVSTSHALGSAAIRQDYQVPGTDTKPSLRFISKHDSKMDPSRFDRSGTARTCPHSP